MHSHPRLEEYLDAYIEAAGLMKDRKGPLFRSAIGKTGQLSDRPMLRGDVWRMVRRRASDAGLEAAIGCHPFRATGTASRMSGVSRRRCARAGHSNAKTTGPYDRQGG